jgi:tetratricopeptide (TPR) repeat protein
MTTDSRLLAAQKLFELGNGFAKAASTREALAFYRGAVALKPDDADIHTKLGQAFESLSRPDEAIGCYREALVRNPAQVLVINHLGTALHAVGRFSEAKLAYQSAIELAPTTGAYYRNLAQCGRMVENDPYLLAMKYLVQQTDALTLDDRVHFHFGLGHALTEMGEREQGFNHLLEGNRLHRSRVDYDEAATLHGFELTRRHMTAEFLRRKHGTGNLSAAPIFIIGMPRSGSTLVEQILASHPDVIAGGELRDFPAAMVQVLGKRQTAAQFKPQTLIAEIESVTPSQWLALGTEYVRRVDSALSTGAPYRRMVDKMLMNFAYIGLIHLALPNARFIHTRRSPVETCLSCFARLFNNIPFSYDLRELGRYYREYDTQMAHWRDVLPEGTLIEVNYEDIVGDLEQQARRIVAHGGLEWDDACVDFHKTRRTVLTASSAQVRQPVYRTSLEAWLPAREHLQPLLDGLGPELAAQVQARLAARA